MRSYATLSPRFWTGETGRALRERGRDAQLLALYLISAPQANMIGLYYLPLTLASHELALSTEEVETAMCSCQECGFCTYDWIGCVVFINEMARHQLGPSLGDHDRRRTGVLALLRTMTDSPLCRAFVDRYGKAYNLNKEADIARGLEGAWKGLTRGLGERAPENSSVAWAIAASQQPQLTSELSKGPGSQRSENREQRSVKLKDALAPGGAEQRDSGQSSLPGMPEALGPGRGGRAPRRAAREPLPFTIGESLEVLNGCQRLVIPDLNGDNGKKRIGQLARIIRICKRKEALQLVADWINAGGGFPRDLDLDRLTSQVDTWVSAATSWGAGGRKPLATGQGRPGTGLGGEDLTDYEDDGHA